MKLGFFTVLYADQSLEFVLDLAKNQGLDAVEIGCGGFIPKNHCNPEELLSDKTKLKAFKASYESRNLILSALSCHGNIVHPDKEIADAHEEDLKNAIRLCGELGINTVVNFSGCPGDGSNAKVPNWVTCTWPDYFHELSEWQWNEVLIPKWKEIATFAREHNVSQIALEMHPGFSVYTPGSLLRLRENVGPEIGSNFDPSHLFWQGINPILAVRALRECIFHVHCKDSAVNPGVVDLNGVLDTKPLNENASRGWNFKTVGYGHGESFWRSFIWELQLIGYDHVLSIEHEDHQMSNNEGLLKAKELLQTLIIREKPAKLWFDS